MATDDIQQLLRTGIEAAQSGNKALARRLLAQVTEQAPDNELAWIWLASVAPSVDERRHCLERVLAINPDNERAQQALTKLARLAQPSAPSHAPPAPEPAEETESAPVRTRTDRAAELEREAILRAHVRRERRRLNPVLFTLLGLLAVAMIAAGAFLLWQESQSEDDEPPTPATRTATQSAAQPTPRPQDPPSYVSPTPVGGVLRTVPVQQPTALPTWTPTATWTPLPSPTATPTPLPLDTFVLLVSEWPEGENAARLITMQADGSQPQRITLRPPSSAPDSDLTLLSVYDGVFSPDGQQVAFTAKVSAVRTEDGEPVTLEFEDIFVAPPQGGAIRRLTQLEASQVVNATWSPDGQQIAFASDADGDFDIYIVNVETGAITLLTRNEYEDRDPAWSPTGDAIAFASDRSGPGFLEIWRVAPDGADLKQLTDNENSRFAPAWSPDGTSIVFLSNRRVNTDLYVMDADGNGERALIVRDRPTEERDPAWSPDGQWIVFSSNRESPNYELFLIRPDGSDLQRVTFETGNLRHADWQP